MYCLELIKFDVSNVIAWSWKMVLGGHRKSWKSHVKYLGEKRYSQVFDIASLNYDEAQYQ